MLMVSNETQQFLLTLRDSEIDYNIKLIIFASLIVYAIILYFMCQRMNDASFFNSIFQLFAKIYIFITTLFLPLFSIMLFREYQAIELWTLLLQAYGVVFVLITLVGTFWGWSRIFGMFGIEFNLGEIRHNKTRKGEK